MQWWESFITCALKNKDRMGWPLWDLGGEQEPGRWGSGCVPSQESSKCEGLASRKGLMSCRHWVLTADMGQVAYQMIWSRAFETMVNMRVIPRLLITRPRPRLLPHSVWSQWVLGRDVTQGRPIRVHVLRIWMLNRVIKDGEHSGPLFWAFVWRGFL